MPLSVDQFAKALTSSGLMTPEELKAYWSAMPAGERPKDGDALAQHLVAAGRLTEFQGRQLLEGRGKSLLMGDYVLLAEIGAGGMGQVYQARHRRMGRVVALKVMSAAAMRDSAAVKRFQREVRAAARLEHPNIVTAYDSGEVDDVKYLVMEFVEGGDLASLVKKQGRLDVETALNYVLQMARGLAYAHDEGVIHRDIKPANLLVDKKGVVKILDMGLARIEGSGDGLTATSQVMGTVDYMSPEQASHTKAAGARSDIYSLGCTLWFLLTGKKVYEADSMIGRLMAHRDAPLPSLVHERDDASWPLEQVLHRMIAKQPQDRFQSMHEVAAALEGFVGGSATQAAGLTLGGGSQTNAQLAAFLRGAKPADLSTKPSRTKGTTHSPDATAALVRPEAGTDPKSDISANSLEPGERGRTAPSASGIAQRSTPRRIGRRLQNLLAVVGAVVVVVLGIVIALNQSGPQEPQPESGAGATGADASASNAASPATAQQVSQLLESPDYVWSEPVNVGAEANNDRSQSHATFTSDELCLICMSQPIGEQSELIECRRSKIDEPFGPQLRLTGALGEREPALSADGLTLAYVSEFESLGKYDLWLRRRTSRDAAWGPPEHLGPDVNGPADERQPTFSPDGLSLLFVSDRPGGKGGLDLWIARRRTTDAPLQRVVNFDERLNTRENESAPQFLPDNETIVFTRNDGPQISFKAASGISSSLYLQGIRGIDAWLSADGRRWYFTDSRPGGLGGRDLWVSHRVAKQTTAPMQSTSQTPSFVTEQQVAEAALNKSVKVLLLGDGFIQRLPTEGDESLQSQLPGRRIANRGRNGLNISTLTDAVNNHEFSGDYPTVIVVQIGYNDLGQDEAELTERYRFLVAELQRQFPDASLVLTTVLPKPGAKSGARRTLNNAIRSLADGNKVRCIDLDTVFADPTDVDAPRAELLAGATISPLGYQRLNEVLRPAIEASLPPPSASK